MYVLISDLWRHLGVIAFCLVRDTNTIAKHTYEYYTYIDMPHGCTYIYKLTYICKCMRLSMVIDIEMKLPKLE